MAHKHFDDISEYCKAVGKPLPLHPQFHISTVTSDGVDCLNQYDSISTDFYAIALKKVIKGSLVYGNKPFDFKSGTMVFFSPMQVFSTNGVSVESEGVIILLHRDFVRGHDINALIKKSSFFSYAVNEALHLSAKEQHIIHSIFDSITVECNGNYDEFSKEIILSMVNSLLLYADRFYRRQFLLRKETSGSLYEQFSQAIDTLLNQAPTNGLPKIDCIAAQLNMTQRYLTDALKAETGKSAKEWIILHLIDHAKTQLHTSNDSINTIAYSLGFEYPQYFTRLFKNKVGVTPSQFRKAH